MKTVWFGGRNGALLPSKVFLLLLLRQSGMIMYVQIMILLLILRESGSERVMVYYTKVKFYFTYIETVGFKGRGCLVMIV